MPVTDGGRTRAEEMALLKLAADGDEGAFRELVDAHRGELHAHCYRMLGSLHDAEDAVQDALFRAWRGLSGFEGRSSVRSWLYSIATNTALDVFRHRSRRELPVSFGPAAKMGDPLEDPRGDALWLEPYPDRWLTGGAGASPEARYEQRESVELAFIVALQALPPRQRAVLILRDVMGFSTAEISSQVGASAPAVNSALQRARAATQASMPARSQQATLRALGDERIREIVQRYSDAMERGDADTLVSMLTEDAAWSMPPIPTWFRGRATIREWLIRDPLTERWRHRPARANGQLALGCYLFDSARGRYTPAVIDVLTMHVDKIAAVTGFLVLDVATRPDGTLVTGPEIFARFGLPAELD
jgi:RNA polymerase sigma-70 factor (ECF subfamily)